MELLVNVMEELSHQPPKCTPQYVEVLCQVYDLPNGPSTTTCKRLIRSGNFTLREFFDAQQKAKEHDRKKEVMTLWLHYWFKKNPKLMDYIFETDYPTSFYRDLRPLIARMNRPLLYLVITLNLWINRVPLTDNSFDTTAKKELESHERWVLDALSLSQESNQYVIGFLGIWAHSRRPFLAFRSFERHSALFLVSYVRHIIGMSRQTSFNESWNKERTPTFSKEDNSWTSGDVKWLVTSSSSSDVEDWSFFNSEFYRCFYFPQMFDWIVVHGPHIKLVNRQLICVEKEIVEEEEEDHETVEDGKMPGKRPMPTQASRQPMRITLKAKRKIVNGRVKKLIDVGSSGMLTFAESKELMMELSNLTKSVLRHSISWYVPPYIWAQRTVEDGFIPGEKLRRLLKSAPGRCNGEDIADHSDTREWHFWNHYLQDASSFTCFRCQLVSSKSKKRKISTTKQNYVIIDSSG